MSFGKKVHEKLRQPKHVEVSLDSLLGILSSAYGTEELDSKTIFNDNTVNWRNLSVENFKLAPKKEDTEGEKQNMLIENDSERINVATSTTSLKPNKNTASDIDLTLFTIRSLEELKQSDNKSEPEADMANTSLNEVKEDSNNKSLEDRIQQIESLPSPFEIDFTEDKTDLKSYLEDLKMKTQQCITVCTLNVTDSNQQVIFDIKITKKISEDELFSSFNIGNPDISLDVTDISKQTKTCIKVPKSYLVSKILFFTDVNKEFGLENLNVTVKCNINVFHWIVQWIKADLTMCKPTLNVSNLKSVLSMAYHLIIDQLVDECLDFFHLNVKNVLEANRGIENVLDDNLLLKLIKRFSNTEIEEISDDFESFKIKMYCTLIKLLVDPHPLLSVGHFSTLATIFHCGSCEKLLHYEMMTSVPCRSDCNQLDLKGELIPLHERSPSWNLSKYVELMHKDLNNWKLVYWRLWGMCHFLTCVECCAPYPFVQSDWCPYHPSDVQYFPLNSTVLYPIGRYECCGEKAFRFNVVDPYSGCKFKSHTPTMNSDEQVKMYKIFRKHKRFISYTPPENVERKNFVKLETKPSASEPLQNRVRFENCGWQGISLAPKEKKDYSLIQQEILNKLFNKPKEKQLVNVPQPLIYNKSSVHFGSMPSSTSVMSKKTDSLSDPFSTEINNKINSIVETEKSNTVPSPRNKIRNKKSCLYSYLPKEAVWQHSELNKDNQDNQRDFEEIAMRNLIKILSSDISTVIVSESVAGTYIRLEAEWWYEHGVDVGFPSSSKNSGSVVNRTFPLSWFRNLTT